MFLHHSVKEEIIFQIRTYLEKISEMISSLNPDPGDCRANDQRGAEEEGEGAEYIDGPGLDCRLPLPIDFGTTTTTMESVRPFLSFISGAAVRPMFGTTSGFRPLVIGFFSLRFRTRASSGKRNKFCHFVVIVQLIHRLT